MKTISGIEFASEHNGTDVFRLIELAYEQGQKDGHSEQLGTNLAEVGTDLISRAEAIDALKRKQDDGKGDLSRFYNTIIQHDIEAIMQLPPIQPEPLQPWEVLAAQAVLSQPAEPQIIRCKGCKYWDTTWTNDFSPNNHYCPMVDGVRKEDWFCAYAERRTDE